VTAPSHTAINPPGAASPMAPSPAAAVSPGATASRSLAGAVASPRQPTGLPLPAQKPRGAHPGSAAAAQGGSRDGGQRQLPLSREAVAQGLTGTVFLLVFVASDGRQRKSSWTKPAAPTCSTRPPFAASSNTGALPHQTANHPRGLLGRIRFKWSLAPDFGHSQRAGWNRAGTKASNAYVELPSLRM